MLMFLISANAEQYCNELLTATTPTSRFTDNDDGTVTDNGTGLMWSKTPDVTRDGWLNTFEKANTSELAGHIDWRIPNVKELLSIVERKCVNPVFNLEVFDFPIVTFYDRYFPIRNYSYAYTIPSSTPYLQEPEDANRFMYELSINLGNLDTDYKVSAYRVDRDEKHGDDFYDISSYYGIMLVRNAE